MADAKDFLGLTKKTAQNKAEAMNLLFRLIRIDSEHFFPYPTETRNDRVCAELDDGVVSVASIR